MYSLKYFPLITYPTRVSKNQNNGTRATLIDHIWSNLNLTSNSGVIDYTLSDHFPTYSVFDNLLKSSDDFIHCTFRDFSLHNKDKFMNKISNVDLFDINDELSVDTNLNKFLDILNNIYNECFPIRRKKVSLKRLSNPWLTPGLLRSIDRCHKLNILYRNGVLQRCSFVKYRNKLTRLIKTQKSAFYKEKFNKCQKDIKATWSNINKLLHANKSKANLSFNLDNINYDTPEDICKAFKDYFSSVSKKLNESIGKTHVTFDKFLRDSPSSSFFVNPSSSVEVERIMASMKNKNAPITDIPSKIYKLAADKLSYFISRLFNQSVQQGVFPQ